MLAANTARPSNKSTLTTSDQRRWRRKDSSSGALNSDCKNPNSGETLARFYDSHVTIAQLGLFVGALTLAVTVPTLLLAARQELRARDRGDIVWEVTPSSQGVFVVRNTGQDVARHVRIEAWTRHELEQSSHRLIAADEHVKVTLPLRQKSGPDPVDVPKPYPRPLGIQVPPQVVEMFERTTREAQERQVSIKVSWRTRWGPWRTFSTFTG